MFEHYLTSALRNLRRFPLTTAVSVVGLSLGFACFVGTYVFVDNLRNTDRQFADSQRIYALTQQLWIGSSKESIPPVPQVSPAAAKYLQADFPQLEAVARTYQVGTLAAGGDAANVSLNAAAVDPDFLKIFKMHFLAGSSTDALSAIDSAVITERAAIRLFGTSSAIGKRIVLQNRVDVTVTGVIEAIPQPSHMGDSPGAMLRFDILFPMNLLRTVIGARAGGMPVNPDAEEWNADFYGTYVLLPRSAAFTPAQFAEGLESFGARHVPPAQGRSVFGAVPVSRIYLSVLDAFSGEVGLSATTTLFLLAGLVLGIACLNYANLSVANATARGKEIAVRKVLGARVRQIVIQQSVEAALLGICCLALVIIAVAVALPFIDSALGVSLRLPRLTELELWVFVVALLAAVCVVGGVYPALVLAGVRPAFSLRAPLVSAGPRLLPGLLVGVQFAAASFLLIMATLMTGQNRLLQQVGRRADRDPVVVITDDVRQLGINFDNLRTELLAAPAVRSVSAMAGAPWTIGGWHFQIRRTPDRSAVPVQTIANQISYDFFETLGIKLLAGRVFDHTHSDPAHAPGGPRNSNVIIDRALAAQLGWSNPTDAIGNTAYESLPMGRGGTAPALSIVGVVDEGYPRLMGVGAQSNLYFLVPEAAGVPVVRIAADDMPAALAQIDTVWHRSAPKVVLQRRFLDEMFTEAYATFGTLGRVLTGLAGFAFLIASMGLIGMAIHVTSRRTREIGIRKTLGAKVHNVILLLMRDFSKPVVLANVAAWPVAFLAGGAYLRLFDQRVTASPWFFLGSLLLTVLVACIAVGGYAYRAARVQPSEVLRFD